LMTDSRFRAEGVRILVKAGLKGNFHD